MSTVGAQIVGRTASHVDCDFAIRFGQPTTLRDLVLPPSSEVIGDSIRRPLDKGSRPWLDSGPGSNDRTELPFRPIRTTPGVMDAELSAKDGRLAMATMRPHEKQHGASEGYR